MTISDAPIVSDTTTLPVTMYEIITVVVVPHIR